MDYNRLAHFYEPRLHTFLPACLPACLANALQPTLANERVPTTRGDTQHTGCDCNMAHSMCRPRLPRGGSQLGGLWLWQLWGSWLWQLSGACAISRGPNETRAQATCRQCPSSLTSISGIQGGLQASDASAGLLVK
jgi:hypothetical protein